MEKQQLLLKLATHGLTVRSFGCLRIVGKFDGKEKYKNEMELILAQSLSFSL